MSEETRNFETWNDVISYFFRRKYEVEEEKYLKEELKSLGGLYDNANYFDDENIKFFFDTKRYKKSKEQSTLNFQRKRAIQVLRLPKHPVGFDVEQKKEDYKKKVEDLRAKFTPSIWLTENAGNAGSVSFATHVIKLTHSRIDAPSLFDCISEQDSAYLTTSSLTEKIIDGAVAGNQFAPIFQFLELELVGMSLAAKLSRDDRIFEKFLPSEESGEKGACKAVCVNGLGFSCQ